MIPTITYDQVRLERQGQLDRLELRRHERAALEHRAARPRTEQVHVHLATSRRLALAASGILAATLALLIF